MKKLNIIVAFLLSITIITAQNTTEEKKQEQGWNYSGIVGVNLNQIALSNWSQGGENTFTWTLLGNFEAKYTKDPIVVTNQLKLSFGKTKVGDADMITNDNEVYMENVLTYSMNWFAEPYVSNTFRSVLANGYDYGKTPKVQTASFFDPAYITQSIGLSYTKIKGFSTRLGIAFQEVITNDFNQYSDDQDTPKIEDFLFETGIESVTKAKYAFKENLIFDSQLRLFTRFEELDVWDVRWDNTITVKISDVFNVNLNALLIYEKKQSLKTQFKEALQIGISYTLF